MRIYIAEGILWKLQSSSGRRAAIVAYPELLKIAEGMMRFKSHELYVTHFMSHKKPKMRHKMGCCYFVNHKNRGSE
jgi:hypothetical protein